MDITVTHSTHAQPEDVWAVMTDIEGSADVLSGVKAVERLDGGSGFGEGLRWRETRVMMGREATEEMEITAVDLEARTYVAEAESSGTNYRSTLSVTRVDAGSVITMTFGADPDGAVQKLLAATLGRLFAGATRKALQQDLADIAAAAEARGA